jgi:formyltetrahydrofolate hydrolase
VLSLSPARPGIVQAVSKFLVEQGCTIVESHQLGDRESGLFMRLAFAPVVGDGATGSVAHAPAAHAPTLAALCVPSLCRDRLRHDGTWIRSRLSSGC